MRKKYDPAIATRIKRKTYNFYKDLAKRRIESISKTVAVALYEYEEKCRQIEKGFEDNAE